MAKKLTLESIERCFLKILNAEPFDDMDLQDWNNLRRQIANAEKHFPKK